MKENIDLIIIDAVRSITECATKSERNIVTHELTKTVEPHKNFWGFEKKNTRAILKTTLTIEITEQI